MAKRKIKGGLRQALKSCKGKKGKSWKKCLRSKGIKPR